MRLQDGVAPLRRHFDTWNDLLEFVTLWIQRRIPQNVHPMLVAIDGPDCAGKTTLAHDLMTRLAAQVPVRVHHFDDYLNPPAIRYRQGVLSVSGFLEDFFDREALRREVLEPAILEKTVRGREPSVIIVEGLFLLQPALVGYFDLRIRLEIPETLVLERAIERDVGVLGDAEEVRAHYQQQCIPGQAIYRESCALDDVVDCLVSYDGSHRYDVRCKGT